MMSCHLYCCPYFGFADALHAVGALFHDTPAANGYIRDVLHLERFGVPVGVGDVIGKNKFD